METNTSSAYALFTIVLLFIACNIPRLILNQVEWTLRITLHAKSVCEIEDDLSRLSLFIQISHFCLIINSSANVLIYYSVCKMVKINMNKITSYLSSCVQSFFVNLKERKKERRRRKNSLIIDNSILVQYPRALWSKCSWLMIIGRLNKKPLAYFSGQRKNLRRSNYCRQKLPKSISLYFNIYIVFLNSLYIEISILNLSIHREPAAHSTVIFKQLFKKGSFMDV